MKLQLFAPLMKVDQEQRLIYGTIAEETADRAGETFDYASSKPYFEEWSNEFARCTDGASVGNLRAMHQLVSAGVLKEIRFDDQARRIDVIAKVVDDGEWQKVCEGVYTGFSVGGKYVRRWSDGAARRYTGRPSEVSLVDRPQVPAATFTLLKADGSEEEVPFKGGAVDDDLAKVAKREDVKPKEGEQKYGKEAKFADERNKKYPLTDEKGKLDPEKIRAAWNYINKPKNAAEYSEGDVKAIKAKIVAAWKDAIDKAGPPAAAENAKKADEGGDLKKGMCGVSQFADLLQALSGFQSAVAWEAQAEADNSPVPQKLKDALESLAAILKEYVSEEADELVAGASPGAPGSVMALADAGGDLEKAGAAISAANLQKIQAVHDHAVDLGASCKSEKADAGGDLLKVDLVKAEDALGRERLRNRLLKVEIAEARKRIAELEREPEPPRGALMDLAKTVVVSKDAENGVAGAAAEPETPADCIKAAHAAGGRAYRG